MDARELDARVDLLVETGDVKGALKLLEQARRDALRAEDVEALQQVLEATRQVHARATQRQRKHAVRIMNATQQDFGFLAGTLSTPSPRSRWEQLSRQVGTWKGLCVATLVASLGGVGIGYLFGLVLYVVNGLTRAPGTRVVWAIPPLVACGVVGFACGRWWAFSGAAALIPILLFWVANGRDAAPFSIALGCVTGSLAIGSALRSGYNAASQGSGPD
jgi:hypothetical protein